MLKDTFNKGISTPIAIAIVLILVVLVGGFTWLQYRKMWREAPTLIEECNQDSDCQDKEYKRSCRIDRITKKCVNHICRVECEMKEGDLTEIKDETADWKTYQAKPFQDSQPHKPWGFEFKYPKEFVLNPSDHPDFPTGSFLKAHRSGVGVWSVNVAVSVALPQSAYSGTNFQGAWLTVAYDPDIANLQNCQELERNEVVEKMSESQIINGVTWYKEITGGAVLGTAVESRVYHTFHNDMCYEMALHLSTTNIANFDPALGTKEVDESEVWAKLENILSTLKFLD